MGSTSERSRTREKGTWLYWERHALGRLVWDFCVHGQSLFKFLVVCLPGGCLPARGCLPAKGWVSACQGGYLPARGVCLPRGGCAMGGVWPVDRILDTRLWKHYLSATLFADGKNIPVGRVHAYHPFANHTCLLATTGCQYWGWGDGYTMGLGIPTWPLDILTPSPWTYPPPCQWHQAVITWHTLNPFWGL